MLLEFPWSRMSTLSLDVGSLTPYLATTFSYIARLELLASNGTRKGLDGGIFDTGSDLLSAPEIEQKQIQMSIELRECQAHFNEGIR